MASNENEKKLVNVMATVFEIPAEQITVDSSPDNIQEWDSLHHMTLVIALEEAFNIELTDDQTVEIMNFQLIKLVLQEHDVKFN